MNCGVTLWNSGKILLFQITYLAAVHNCSLMFSIEQSQSIYAYRYVVVNYDIEVNV